MLQGGFGDFISIATVACGNAAMASTVAAQQIVVRGRQTQNSFKPLAYLKSETLKAPAQNVGARYTALHSLPQPPITVLSRPAMTMPQEGDLVGAVPLGQSIL